MAADTNPDTDADENSEPVHQARRANMSTELSFEERQRGLLKLRVWQRSLCQRFLSRMSELSSPEFWQRFSNDFADVLARETLLESHWIGTDRYPFALYNIFVALGFQVFAGPFPRVSGVHLDYRTPLLAFHQVQRLFESSAELFVIQYNGDIDERVVAEARQKVLLLRSMGAASACCAIVDGLDTARLLAAYGRAKSTTAKE